MISQAPPKITPFTFGEEPANVEDSVSVTCLISSGDLPIDIEWLFNDYGISSYSGINVVKGGKRNSMLSIDNVQARHAGKYSCKAKNHAAAENYTTELIVNGTECQDIVELYSSISVSLFSLLCLQVFTFNSL